MDIQDADCAIRTRFGVFFAFLKIIYKILFVCSILCGTLWFYFYITGHISRPYETLDIDYRLWVGDTYMTIEDLAIKYQPVFCVSEPEVEFFLPSFVWYESLLVKGDKLVLVYHPVWENEVHPNTAFDFLYALFRWAYYGSVYDIEYIQIEISLEDGSIERVRFETGNASDYYNMMNKHLLADLSLEANNLYSLDVFEKSGEFIYNTNNILSPFFENSHIVFRIVTWNHLFSLGDSNDENCSNLFLGDLFYMNDRTYSDYKLIRRSQGDYFNDSSGPYCIFDRIGAILLSATIIYLFARGKGNA